MNNINDLFVPYAESLEIKALGFNEPCLAVHYTLDGKHYKFADICS